MESWQLLTIIRLPTHNLPPHVSHGILTINPGDTGEFMGYVGIVSINGSGYLFKEQYQRIPRYHAYHRLIHMQNDAFARISPPFHFCEATRLLLKERVEQGLIIAKSLI